MREECEVLEYHPHPALLGGHMPVLSAHQHTVDPDLPCRRRLEASDRPEQRGLAAAARSQEAADITLLHGKRHLVQHYLVVEGDRGPVSLQGCGS